MDPPTRPTDRFCRTWSHGSAWWSCRLWRRRGAKVRKFTTKCEVSWTICSIDGNLCSLIMQLEWIKVESSRKFASMCRCMWVFVSSYTTIEAKRKKKVLKSNYSRNDAVVCRSSNSRRVDWLVNCLKVMTHELPIRIRNLIGSSQRDQLRNRSKSYDAGTKFSTDVGKKTLKSMIMSSALWCCKLNPLRCVVVGALDFF